LYNIIRNTLTLKIMTQEEILKSTLFPNYCGSGLFVNPNPQKGIVETPKLNKLSEFARTTDFFKKFVSQEGFELSPADFKWEWIINFNKKSGFMVFREQGNHLRMFVYKTADDLNWQEGLIKDFKTNETSMSKLVNLIKSMRYDLK
jgi:hypothetical protein